MGGKCRLHGAPDFYWALSDDPGAWSRYGDLPVFVNVDIALLHQQRHGTSAGTNAIPTCPQQYVAVTDHMSKTSKEPPLSSGDGHLAAGQNQPLGAYQSPALSAEDIDSTCDVCEDILAALQEREPKSRLKTKSTSGESVNPIVRRGPSRDDRLKFTGEIIPLGDKVQTLLGLGCKHHRDLLKGALVRRFQASEIQDVWIYKAHLEDHVEIRGRIASTGKAVSTGKLQLLGPIANSQAGREGIPINDSWIDDCMLRQWKETCFNEHGSKCEESPAVARLPGSKPALLIDIRDECLVEGTGTETYIALSYVWGKTNPFMTLKQNLDRLKGAYSLSEGKTNPPVSRTIRQAMGLVGKLKERYLWADQLCIVQDDGQQKMVEINKMSAIYAHASLVIIAAHGLSADSELRGLYGISSPRSVRQEVYPMPRGLQILQSAPGPAASTTEAVWQSRGWTYQEYTFSRRKLIFDGDTVRWECDRCARNESTAPGRDLKPLNLSTRSLFSSVLPVLRDLSGVITMYNTRDFTYPGDVVHGFAGIASVMDASFRGGFVSGIPVVFFDAGLLWQPRTSVVRRVPGISGSAACLPSWSWMGWQGNVGMWMWDSVSDFVKLSTQRHGAVGLERITPLVKWTLHETPTDPGKPCGQSWSEYRQRYLNVGDEEPCPPGWSRHKGEGEPPGGTDGGLKNLTPDPPNRPRYVYKHESEPNSEFWYPIPLPTSSQQKASAQPPIPLISGQTRRASLVGGELFTTQLWGYGSMISLRDEAGVWMGALQLHDEPAKAISGHELLGAALELVEIARASALEEPNPYTPKVLDEWDHSERPRAGERYEYYYVMWIEWERGIAYRKGLGRVEKSAWESQKLESLRMMLG